MVPSTKRTFPPAVKSRQRSPRYSLRAGWGHDPSRGCVAAAEDGARLGKGGGFADLEYALATAAGLIGPHTVSVTTVHELQVRAAGTIPLTGHDVPVDLIVTPERVIDCRPRHGPRPAASICWDDLTEEKIAAIPLLAAQRPGQASELRAAAGRAGALPADQPPY